MPDEIDQRIEAALRAAPPGAPPQMAARIMERVELVERARERFAESSRARPRGWLAVFASEPAAAVSLALVPVCLVFWLVLPDTAAKLALLVHESLAAWIAGVSGGFVARSGVLGLGGLGPHAASVLQSAVASALLAISFSALPWIAELFRRIRPPTSSQKSRPPSR